MNSDTLTVWGHNGTSTVDWTTSANLTSGSGFLANYEFFNSNFSDSLTTNSTWSQSNGGPIVGSNDATYTLASNYNGGSSSGYGGSYNYFGGQNWTWSDPNLSTYNARALSEFRIMPAGPPEVGPVTFRSAPNVAFNTSPALVEDAEATAATANESDDLTVSGFIWGLIPGSSLVDAYYEYQKGNYVNAGVKSVYGVADLVTVGSMTRVRGGLKLFVRFMKARVKDELVDMAANQAGKAVAERYGEEAGFVTQEIVSAALNRGVSQQNKTQLGFAADGGKRQIAKQVTGPGQRLAGQIATIANKRPFADRMKDASANPTNWKVVRKVIEPSTAIRNRGGTSLQEILRHNLTGETIIRHTLFRANGSIFEPAHFRDILK